MKDSENMTAASEPTVQERKTFPPEPLGCNYQGYEFGAHYPDSVCIDGYLWDADSCDEPGGGLSIGGDIPCPHCNTLEYLNQARRDAEDGGCGAVQWTPWVAATAWENSLAIAHRENPDVLREWLVKCEPFFIDDWPDRNAVCERRASWEDTYERQWPWPIPALGSETPSCKADDPDAAVGGPNQQQEGTKR